MTPGYRSVTQIYAWADSLESSHLGGRTTLDSHASKPVDQQQRTQAGSISSGARSSISHTCVEADDLDVDVKIDLDGGDACLSK
jgi:hypothetical protein